MIPIIRAGSNQKGRMVYNEVSSTMHHMQDFTTKSLVVAATDGASIYGTLTKPRDEALSAIIFVHGLLSGQNLPVFVEAASFFSSHTIASLRYDLYSERIDARPFFSASLRTQARDLRSVAAYVAAEYEQVYIVAHSLGAVVALLAVPERVRGLVLWEPSLHPADVFLSAVPTTQSNSYMLQENPRVNISSDVVHEAQTIPPIATLLQKAPVPVGIICAQHAGQVHCKELYVPNTQHKAGFHVISGAGHNFEEACFRGELYEKTLDMLNGMTHANSRL